MVRRKLAKTYRTDPSEPFAKLLAKLRIFQIAGGMKTPATMSPDGPIAQLDRVTDFYSVGCRFESCWDRQSFQKLTAIFVPLNMLRLLRTISFVINNFLGSRLFDAT
jgi:hypothetical protein